MIRAYKIETYTHISNSFCVSLYPDINTFKEIIMGRGIDGLVILVLGKWRQKAHREGQGS